MIINGTGNAVAFCGGVDVNPDRLDDTHHYAGSPFHDVHAKVEGPAVGDLNATFVQRWNYHPSHPVQLPTDAPPFGKSTGSQYVQVTRTFPAGKYPFAPSAGEQGTLNAIRHAIQRARSFIYLEDQYATPYPADYQYYQYDASQDTVGILTDLRAALERSSFEFLIIVIPNHTDQPQNRYRRYCFLSYLRDTAPDKVHVFYLSRLQEKGQPTESATAAADLNLYPPGGIADKSQSSGGPSYRKEIYVHAKSWIVDDIYVKIGSANCNRRSLTHDSEVDIHILDGALKNGVRAFARNYRLALWGEHLNMTSESQRAQLEDPTFALQFWMHPPRGAKITKYDWTNDSQNWNPELGAWNTFIDPDGR
jgi:phosphatidylserine/phosphatidylglycerophosphate/cardiolipin synthase-like enzyme